MNLIIENINTEELRIICARLGECSFLEMSENNRIEGIAKHINEGDSVEQARVKWQEEIVDQAEQVLKESDNEKDRNTTRKEIKEQLGFIENNLHLDGTPPEKQEQKITHKEIADFAGQIARSGKGQLLKEIIDEFNVKRLVDIPEDKLVEVYQKLKEVAN